tara:strand:+ start:171 stop:419 length:249 start_codon:yes stop_codon:yes gene_type:complete
MKSIYERLNPEILASINADKQKYPYTTRALKKKLKSSDDWSQLSISDVQTIIIHSHDKFVELNYIDFMWGDRFLINGINNNG